MIGKILLTILLLGISNACSDDDSLPPEFDTPRETWDYYKRDSYALMQMPLCFCIFNHDYLISVRNNQIIEVIDPETGEALPESQFDSFRTVDQLFDLIEQIDPDDVASINYEFHDEYGFPSQIFVDPDVMIADEEYGWRTSLRLPF